MKEFEKWYENIGINMLDNCLHQLPKGLAEETWRAGLEMANKLFLDGMHPQDVMFFIQKELEQ